MGPTDYLLDGYESAGSNQLSYRPERKLAAILSSKAGGAQSTFYVANIASTILDLIGNASPGLGRTIKQRLRTAFRPTDDHAYDAALVELEMGGMIASRLSPVLLEPLVPEELRSTQIHPCRLTMECA